MDNNLNELAAVVGIFSAAVEEAITCTLNRMEETIKPIIDAFGNIWSGLAVILENKEMQRYLRQRSIQNRRQQLERSRKRQQLLAQSRNKSNNWRRLHGLPTRRKIKNHCKNH